MRRWPAAELLLRTGKKEHHLHNRNVVGPVGVCLPQSLASGPSAIRRDLYNSLAMHCLVAPVTHALRQQPIQRQSLSCSRLHRRANVIMHTTTAMVKNRSINNPDDSPLRDGNRDRLYGLLTERACATLIAYTIETNQVRRSTAD